MIHEVLIIMKLVTNSNPVTVFFLYEFVLDHFHFRH